LHCKPGRAVKIKPLSPGAASGKREFFKCPLETIGYFSLRMPKIGAWRLIANPQKPAIGGAFCEYQGSSLRLPDCLADLGRFELAHSQLRNAP
jgi:hypothetical protein